MRHRERGCVSPGPDRLIDMLALSRRRLRPGPKLTHIDHGETLIPGPREAPMRAQFPRPKPTAAALIIRGRSVHSVLLVTSAIAIGFRACSQVELQFRNQSTARIRSSKPGIPGPPIHLRSLARAPARCVSQPQLPAPRVRRRAVVFPTRRYRRWAYAFSRRCLYAGPRGVSSPVYRPIECSRQTWSADVR